MRTLFSAAPRRLVPAPPGQRFERQLARKLEERVAQHLLHGQTGCAGDGRVKFLRRRRGNFLVRLLGIYLLIQIVAMLFGSCGYRGAYYDPYYYRNYSYSDSGTYSGQSQSQTGSDTGSGSWY